MENECNGCKYENSTDIEIHLEKCTHCKRAYHQEEDREIHKDLYIKDFCEWRLVHDECFIQNPHTKRMFSNETSMQNVYCNTCGKKIKKVN